MVRCPRVMQNFRSKTLSLRGRLTGGFASAWLARNTFIVDLDLSDNPLGDRGLVELFTAVRDNPILRNLTLARVCTAITPAKSAASLQECMSADTVCRLQSLNLDGNRLTDTFCKVAFGGMDTRLGKEADPGRGAVPAFDGPDSVEGQVMLENGAPPTRRKLGNSLRVLSLQDNGLYNLNSGTFDSPEHSAARCVQSLSVGWNRGNVGLSPFTSSHSDGQDSCTFASSFRTSVINSGTFIRLRSLEVSYCALSDDEGALLGKTLATMPTFGRIRSVDASGNRFGHKAAMAFSRVVLENADLQNLKLSQNTALGVVGVVGIVLALARNKSLADCWIDGCMSLDPMIHGAPPGELTMFVTTLIASSIDSQQIFRRKVHHSFMETTRVLLNFLPGVKRKHQRGATTSLPSASFPIQKSPWRELIDGARLEIHKAQEEASVSEELMIQLSKVEPDSCNEDVVNNNLETPPFDPELSKYFCARRRAVESKQLLDTPFFDDCFSSDWAILMTRRPFINLLISSGSDVSPDKFIKDEGDRILQSPYIQDAKMVARQRYNAVICLYRHVGSSCRVTQKDWSAMVKSLGFRFSSKLSAGKCLEVFRSACSYTLESVLITVDKAREFGFEAPAEHQNMHTESKDSTRSPENRNATDDTNKAEKDAVAEQTGARFDFIEALFRLSLLKYGRSKKDGAAAFVALFDNHILPFCSTVSRWRDADGGGEAPHGSMDSWRMNCYYKKDVHTALQRFNGLASLTRIFERGCESRESKSQYRMGMESFVQLMKPLLSHTLTEDIVVKCFKMAVPISKSLGEVKDLELSSSQQGGHFKLPLPAFLEALFRLASCAVRMSESTSETAENILLLLEKWLQKF